MPPEKWLLFDLGNVLIKFDHHRVSRALCSEFNQPALLNSIHDFFFTPHHGVTRNAEIDRGRMSIEQLHHEFSETFAMQMTLPLFQSFWCNIFDELDTQALTTMEHLHSQGHRVAICSNTNPYHWNGLLEKHPALRSHHFFRFLSYEMKLLKSDPGFFEHIALRTQAPRENHLLIDDLDINLHAANQAGMRTLKVIDSINYDLVSSFLQIQPS